MRKERAVIIEKNWPMEIAGSLWSFPEVHFTTDFRGNKTVAVKEMLRCQTAAAIHICEENSELTLAEFDLLCSLTSLTATKVAKILRISKSTISDWREPLNSEGIKSGEVTKKKIPYACSKILKPEFLILLLAEKKRHDAKKQS